MIGIIGAVVDEISLLLTKLDKRSTQTIGGIRFFRGRLEGHRVVVCAGGVGKVNAGMTTEILIDKFRAKQIIFTGTAGGLLPTLHIGDVVISTATQQYDVNFSALGYPRGVIPGLRTSIFPANTALIRAARRAAPVIQKGKVVRGKIVSGDRFVAKPRFARYLRTRFHASCVEAEGGATGQVCFRNHVPYIVIRGISDMAGANAPENYDEYARLAARRAERLVLGMLRSLPHE